MTMYVDFTLEELFLNVELCRLIWNGQNGKVTWNWSWIEWM